ncbi:hypothetical protein QNH39_25560 [Neobacillus novalis]|uniref:Uncharacterized protein n=1 Tax=Neobacillus novalis TaxID=220687 RepID=A0AA95SC95_9BACI|nr:hypothetical protein [Neobacillus novalis]WHY85903.1 hypothetical protein QNH39_25560 [Neobacillus novalis]
MSDKIHAVIQQQLKELPQPVLTAEKQEQMLDHIHTAANKYHKRRKWENAMKRVYLGAVTIAALIILSILGFNQMADKNSRSGSIPEHSTPSESGIVSNYIDPPGLTVHQVALNNLYVEIPYQKQDVKITKRTTDKYIFVDIKDKETGKVLYTYGESVGHDKEKLVFREIQTKKTKVRLQMFVEIDSIKGLITKVNKTEAGYDPQPNKIEAEVISSGSRSGKFPAENVELLSSVGLNWGNDIQHLYEGYVIGVIKN